MFLFFDVQGDSTEINVCTSFDVIIDEIAVSSSNNLMTAVTVFLASFYVFNLAYPTCLKKTLSFFQKIVLNIQDNIPLERSVLSLLEKLNKNI